MRLSQLFVLVTTCLMLYATSVIATTNYAQQLQRISTDEGLSQSYVTQIIQDDIGYIWIATAQGLNRFDGYTVKPFGVNTPLDESYIVTLFKTHNGDIFVSTESAGAYLINPSTLNTQQVYTGSLSHEDTRFAPIETVIQHDDTLFFAILNSVYSFNLKNNAFSQVIKLEHESIIRSFEYVNNNLYLGTHEGLYQYGLTTSELLKLALQQPHNQNADNNNVKFLAIDKEMGLLVGTVEGMYLIGYDNNHTLDYKNTAINIIPSYNIWDYVNTPYGEFIATEQGLFEYFRADNKTELVLSFDQSKYNITENTINDVMVDKTGVFWLASRTQGALTWSIHTRRFEKTTLPGNNFINTIYQDTDGSIWYGTDNGLAHNKNNQTLYFLKSDDPKAVYGEHAVYDIHEAHLTENSDYLWLARYYELTLFDKNSGKEVLKKDLNSTFNNKTDIYGLAEIADDTFAFFTDDNFFIYDGKSGVTRVIKDLKAHTDPLKAYTFHKPLSSHPNELLLSTSSHFYRYNEASGKLTQIYQTAKSNDKNYHTVENWIIDNNNTLWLATTSEGLVGLNAKSYEKKYHFNIGKGLQTESIYAFEPDQYGNIWFSSKNGLYRIDISTQSLRAFTVKDGLAVNQFTPLGAIKLNNQKLMFGTSYGAVSIDPKEFTNNASNMVVNTHITNVTLLSKDLKYFPDKFNIEPLILNNDDMGLEFSFSNFDFNNINNTRYKVTLEGPTPLNYNNLTSNKIFFTKLQPGTYTLIAQSYNLNDKKMSEPTSIEFEVEHAAWFSPYAYTAYFLITLSILCLIFWQYRSRQIAIAHAHYETLQSQKQTELALSNNKSGIWDYYYKDDTVNTNRGEELGYTNLPPRIPINRYLALIHPEDRPRIEAYWLAYLQQTETTHWQATYRLQHQQGHWLWYQDLGQVILDEDTQTPLYVSGIYTNITEQRANEQQASILGEAFGQINDWLLILDNNMLPFSANNSFIKTFSYKNDSALSTKVFLKAIGKTQCKQIAHTLRSLNPRENWRTDTYIKTNLSQNHPVHISATAITRDDDAISYYVIVISDLTEQKKAENELRYLANYDPLTHLPNRSLMYQNISKAIKNAQKNNAHCALLFIDLDKFKPVNDTFGHAVGDQLLCNITQRVNAILPNKTLLGRQSGDEFLVLIEQVTDLTFLKETVNKLSDELANKVTIEDFSINISASIGVALFPDDATTTDILIRNADVAMMHAKQAGRNGYKFFDESMNEKIKQKLILENDLKDATRDQLLFNHYQPIVDTQTQTINGVELLMRWENKTQFVSPALFIPIAEETGLIETLTEQALNRALVELAPTLSANPRFYISLNLSPKHILRANIANRLIEILAKHNVTPVQLRLEITENILLEDKHKAAKQLKKLKAAGFKLLLDDFGTGYSSLTYLSQFPIDVIKIDQSFVNNIGADKGDESIVKTIYTLAKNLDLYCIAEGVETHQQKAFLANLGCHVLQGYYFAKPMRAEQLQNENTLAQISKLIKE